MAFLMYAYRLISEDEQERHNNKPKYLTQMKQSNSLWINRPRL